MFVCKRMDHVSFFVSLYDNEWSDGRRIDMEVLI